MQVSVVSQLYMQHHAYDVQMQSITNLSRSAAILSAAEWSKSVSFTIEIERESMTSRYFFHHGAREAGSNGSISTFPPGHDPYLFVVGWLSEGKQKAQEKDA
jgi:hypothetical protein